MEFRKKLQKNKLGIVVLTSIALISCMSGTPHGNTNKSIPNDTAEHKKLPISVSQLGKLPVSNLTKGISYPLIVTNNSSDRYKLRLISTVNVSKNGKESQETLRAELVDITNKELSPHGQLVLKITSLAKTSALIKLTLEFENTKTGDLYKSEQIIQLSNHNYTNQGLTYHDSNQGLNVNYGHYDFSLPILLQRDFSSLSTNNGTLECLNGYQSDSGCVLHFTGDVSKDTSYNFRLSGITSLLESVAINGTFGPSQKQQTNAKSFFAQDELIMGVNDETETIVITNTQTSKEQVDVSLSNAKNLGLLGHFCDDVIDVGSKCEIGVAVTNILEEASGIINIDSKDINGAIHKQSIQVYKPAANVLQPSIQFSSLPEKIIAYKGDVSKYDIEVENTGNIDLRNSRVEIPTADCGLLSFDVSTKVCSTGVDLISPGAKKKFSLYFKPKVNGSPAVINQISLSLDGDYGANLKYKAQSKTINYWAEEVDANILTIGVNQGYLNIVPGDDSKSATLRLKNLMQQTALTINDVSIVAEDDQTISIPGLSVDKSTCKQISGLGSCDMQLRFGPLDKDQIVPNTKFKVLIKFNSASNKFAKLTKFSDILSAIADSNQNKLVVEYTGIEAINSKFATETYGDKEVRGLPLGDEVALVYSVKNNFNESVRFIYPTGIEPINSVIFPVFAHDFTSDCPSVIKPNHSCTVRRIRKIKANNILFDGSGRLNKVWALPYKYQVKSEKSNTVIFDGVFPYFYPPLEVYAYDVGHNKEPLVKVTVGTNYDPDNKQFKPDSLPIIGEKGNSFIIDAEINGYNPIDNIPLNINSKFNGNDEKLGIEVVNSCKTSFTNNHGHCKVKFTQLEDVSDQKNRDYVGGYEGGWSGPGAFDRYYNYFPDVRHVSFLSNNSNITLADFHGTGNEKFFNYLFGSRLDANSFLEVPLDAGWDSQYPRRLYHFDCFKNSRQYGRYSDVKKNIYNNHNDVHGKCNARLAIKVTNNWDNGTHICSHCMRPWYTQGDWIENTMK